MDVELDSISLKNFNETILEHYKGMSEYPHLITIPKKDLEKTEARDKYEEVEQAQDELIEKIDLEDNYKPSHQKLAEKWTRHFIRSPHYKMMDKSLRRETRCDNRIIYKSDV